MRVLLLAAGRSVRMQPIEDKNFLTFFGKPLIEHQIESLKKAGLKDILIVGNKHNLKQLRKYGKTIEQKNLELGMAGAVISAERYIKNQPLLIVSSHDVVEETAFLSLRTKTDSDVVLLAKRVKTYFPGGYLVIKNRSVQKMVEKPGAGNEPSDLVNIVVHLHRDPKKLLAALEKVRTSNDDHYETALNLMMKQKMKISALPYNGFWQPVKYPWHVLALMKYFISGIEERFPRGRINGKPTEVAKTAVIKGTNVYFEDGVKILDHATVVGPCYLGKNVVIGNNALVRESHIGENSIIGYGTEVARSYIGEHCRFHSNYIGDSVIGDNTSFGAGCVTGNLRLDEKEILVPIRYRDGSIEKVPCGSNKFGLVTGKNVRVGINVSFMPGVKIGNDSFIGAGMTVSEDIPDKKFAYGKWKLEIKEQKLRAVS